MKEVHHLNTMLQEGAVRGNVEEWHPQSGEIGKGTTLTKGKKWG